MEMDFKSMKRKDLQALCKKHGLPGNPTNSKMAESLAALLQTEDMIKRKGCLRNSGGSSGEDAVRGQGASKKVTFSLHGEKLDHPELRENPDGKSLPRRSRRRSIVGMETEKRASLEGPERGLHIPIRTTRSGSLATAVLWSPVIERKKARTGTEGVRQNDKPPPETRLHIEYLDDTKTLEKKSASEVPTARSLRNRVVIVGGDEDLLEDLELRRTYKRRRSVKGVVEEVLAPQPEDAPVTRKSGKEVVVNMSFRTTRSRASAEAVLRSPIVKNKKARKGVEAIRQNDEPPADVRLPPEDEGNLRKAGKKSSDVVPTMRSLRNRVVVVGGDEGFPGDLEVRRTQKSSKSIRGIEDDALGRLHDQVSLTEKMVIGEVVRRKDLHERPQSLVSGREVVAEKVCEEVPPRKEATSRRSRRNLSKSKVLLQGNGKPRNQEDVIQDLYVEEPPLTGKSGKDKVDERKNLRKRPRGAISGGEVLAQDGSEKVLLHEEAPPRRSRRNVSKSEISLPENERSETDEVVRICRSGTLGKKGTEGLMHQSKIVTNTGAEVEEDTEKASQPGKYLKCTTHSLQESDREECGISLLAGARLGHDHKGPLSEIEEPPRRSTRRCSMLNMSDGGTQNSGGNNLAVKKNKSGKQSRKLQSVKETTENSNPKSEFANSSEAVVVRGESPRFVQPEETSRLSRPNAVDHDDQLQECGSVMRLEGSLLDNFDMGAVSQFNRKHPGDLERAYEATEVSVPKSAEGPFAGGRLGCDHKGLLSEITEPPRRSTRRYSILNILDGDGQNSGGNNPAGKKKKSGKQARKLQSVKETIENDAPKSEFANSSEAGLVRGESPRAVQPEETSRQSRPNAVDHDDQLQECGSVMQLEGSLQDNFDVGSVSQFNSKHPDDLEMAYGATEVSVPKSVEGPFAITGLESSNAIQFLVNSNKAEKQTNSQDTPQVKGAESIMSTIMTNSSIISVDAMDHKDDNCTKNLSLSAAIEAPPLPAAQAYAHYAWETDSHDNSCSPIHISFHQEKTMPVRAKVADSSSRGSSYHQSVCRDEMGAFGNALMTTLDVQSHEECDVVNKFKETLSVDHNSQLYESVSNVVTTTLMAANFSADGGSKHDRAVIEAEATQPMSYDKLSSQICLEDEISETVPSPLDSVKPVEQAEVLQGTSNDTEISIFKFMHVSSGISERDMERLGCSNVSSFIEEEGNTIVTSEGGFYVHNKDATLLIGEDKDSGIHVEVKGIRTHIVDAEYYKPNTVGDGTFFDAPHNNDDKKDNEATDFIGVPLSCCHTEELSVLSGDKASSQLDPEDFVNLADVYVANEMGSHANGPSLIQTTNNQDMTVKLSVMDAISDNKNPSNLQRDSIGEVQLCQQANDTMLNTQLDTGGYDSVSIDKGKPTMGRGSLSCEVVSECFASDYLLADSLAVGVGTGRDENEEEKFIVEAKQSFMHQNLSSDIYSDDHEHNHRNEMSSEDIMKDGMDDMASGSCSNQKHFNLLDVAIEGGKPFSSNFVALFEEPYSLDANAPYEEGDTRPTLAAHFYEENTYSVPSVVDSNTAKELTTVQEGRCQVADELFASTVLIDQVKETNGPVCDEVYNEKKNLCDVVKNTIPTEEFSMVSSTERTRFNSNKKPGTTSEIPDVREMTLDNRVFFRGSPIHTTGLMDGKADIFLTSEQSDSKNVVRNPGVVSVDTYIVPPKQEECSTADTNKEAFAETRNIQAYGSPLCKSISEASDSELSEDQQKETPAYGLFDKDLEISLDESSFALTISGDNSVLNDAKFVAQEVVSEVLPKISNAEAAVLDVVFETGRELGDEVADKIESIVTFEGEVNSECEVDVGMKESTALNDKVDRVMMKNLGTPSSSKGVCEETHSAALTCSSLLKTIDYQSSTPRKETMVPFKNVASSEKLENEEDDQEFSSSQRADCLGAHGNGKGAFNEQAFSWKCLGSAEQADMSCKLSIEVDNEEDISNISMGRFEWKGCGDSEAAEEGVEEKKEVKMNCNVNEEFKEKNDGPVLAESDGKDIDEAAPRMLDSPLQVTLGIEGHASSFSVSEDTYLTTDDATKVLGPLENTSGHGLSSIQEQEEVTVPRDSYKDSEAGEILVHRTPVTAKGTMNAAAHDIDSGCKSYLSDTAQDFAALRECELEEASPSPKQLVTPLQGLIQIDMIVTCAENSTDLVFNATVVPKMNCNVNEEVKEKTDRPVLGVSDGKNIEEAAPTMLDSPLQVTLGIEGHASSFSVSEDIYLTTDDANEVLGPLENTSGHGISSIQEQEEVTDPRDSYEDSEAGEILLHRTAVTAKGTMSAAAYDIDSGCKSYLSDTVQDFAALRECELEGASPSPKQSVTPLQGLIQSVTSADLVFTASVVPKMNCNVNEEVKEKNFTPVLGESDGKDIEEAAPTMLDSPFQVTLGIEEGLASSFSVSEDTYLTTDDANEVLGPLEDTSGHGISLIQEPDEVTEARHKENDFADNYMDNEGGEILVQRTPVTANGTMKAAVHDIGNGCKSCLSDTAQDFELEGALPARKQSVTPLQDLIQIDIKGTSAEYSTDLVFTTSVDPKNFVFTETKQYHDNCDESPDSKEGVTMNDLSSEDRKQVEDTEDATGSQESLELHEGFHLSFPSKFESFGKGPYGPRSGESKSEEVWVPPGAALQSLKVQFRMDGEASVGGNDNAAEALEENKTGEENFEQDKFNAEYLELNGSETSTHIVANRANEQVTNLQASDSNVIEKVEKGQIEPDNSKPFDWSEFEASGLLFNTEEKLFREGSISDVDQDWNLIEPFTTEVLPVDEQLGQDGGDSIYETMVVSRSRMNEKVSDLDVAFEATVPNVDALGLGPSNSTSGEPVCEQCIESSEKDADEDGFGGLNNEATTLMKGEPCVSNEDVDGKISNFMLGEVVADAEESMSRDALSTDGGLLFSINELIDKKSDGDEVVYASTTAVYDPMDEITCRLTCFRISSAKKSAKSLKRRLVIDGLNGKENTPSFKLDRAWKHNAEKSSVTGSTRRPLQRMQDHYNN